MGHVVTAVRDVGDRWEIECLPDEDTEGEGITASIAKGSVSARMAEFGITDPQEAFDHALHELYWHLVRPADRRNDPAVEQGWVTTTDPDAEPIHLYNALSGADAAGAQKARVAACKSIMDLRDPDGLLPAAEHDPDVVSWGREMVDTLRWEQVYGGLPAEPLPEVVQTPAPGPARIPIQED